MTLPAESREDLLNLEECTQILGNFLGSPTEGELVSYKIEQESGPIGYLGEYYHLYMTYKLKGNPSVELQKRFFVKTMPYQNADMSAFIEKSGMLFKESNLYQSLLNKLRTFTNIPWCAQCFLIRKDLFVMENLMDLGFQSTSGPDGFLNHDQVKALLKGLAIMHACSIGYEVQENLVIGDKLKQYLYEVTVSPSVRWYIAGIEAVSVIALQHPSYQSEEDQNLVKHNLPQHVEQIYKLVDPSSKYRNVFCHRDPWGGNVFFDPSGQSSAFVDFQLCRYCPAAIDVVMATYLNIKPNRRKPVMADLCRHYYDIFAFELAKMGIKADEHMSWQQFQESVKETEIFGALYNSLSATILRVPGDYLKSMKANDPEAFHRYTNIDRTKEVLELVQTDEQFRSYMYECVDDLMQTMKEAKGNKS